MLSADLSPDLITASWRSVQLTRISVTTGRTTASRRARLQPSMSTSHRGHRVIGFQLWRLTRTFPSASGAILTQASRLATAISVVERGRNNRPRPREADCDEKKRRMAVGGDPLTDISVVTQW